MREANSTDRIIFFPGFCNNETSLRNDNVDGEDRTCQSQRDLHKCNFQDFLVIFKGQDPEKIGHIHESIDKNQKRVVELRYFSGYSDHKSCISLICPYTQLEYENVH